MEKVAVILYSLANINSVKTLVPPKELKLYEVFPHSMDNSLVVLEHAFHLSIHLGIIMQAYQSHV